MYRRKNGVMNFKIFSNIVAYEILGECRNVDTMLSKYIVLMAQVFVLQSSSGQSVVCGESSTDRRLGASEDAKGTIIPTVRRVVSASFFLGGA